MDRTSDTAIEIINGLHRERLDYETEYIPLIDCANQCKAYEDTGLTPEEIETLQEWHDFRDSEDCISADRLRALAEADRDGRVVVLPCKVGDTVYRTFVVEGRKPLIMEVKMNNLHDIVCFLDKFGKTVFLTREEAEAALGKEQK